MNVEELAGVIRDGRDKNCDCNECHLAAAILIAIAALEKIQDGNGNYLQITFEALAKIREGET